MHRIVRYCLLPACLLVAGLLHAQQEHPRFWNNIQQFKQQDSIQSPPQHAILFVGSSSFTKWTDLQAYFPDYTVINRGFGGSTIPDVIRYANDIIIPYHPRQIVIYCGDNDVASSDKVTADTVLGRFKQLFYQVRAKLPEVNIVFISIKPSPSRQRLMPVMDQANEKIKSFLRQQPNAAFVDVYHLMLDKDGAPRKELFLGDNLHMNAKGYAIWQKAIQPYLVR